MVGRRDERLVWVVPGTTTDRQGNVRPVTEADRLPPITRVSGGFPADTLNLERSRIRPRLAPVSSNHGTRRVAKRWRRGDSTLGPARDPLSLLWQLEQHRGSFQILLFLYKQKSASTSRLRSRLKSGQVSIESSLQSLVRLGFVERNCDSEFPFTKAYSLTRRGVSLIETPPRSWHNFFPI